MSYNGETKLVQWPVAQARDYFYAEKEGGQVAAVYAARRTAVRAAFPSLPPASVSWLLFHCRAWRMTMTTTAASVPVLF